ncbi:41927_t:CDS:2, partial [Gigaspora margarita]
DYDKEYVCKHETTTECKRPLIFDVKLSAACLELGSVSIGFSHENSDKMFTQHKTYTKRKCERVVKGMLTILDKNVKKALNDTTHVKLHEISEKYDHFYARRLIVGGIIVRNEEYIENLGIILRTQKFWRQSLNDSTRWKIIVYEEVYLLFESLEEKLKKEVLAVMGHQILE